MAKRKVAGQKAKANSVNDSAQNTSGKSLEATTMVAQYLESGSQQNNASNQRLHVRDLSFAPTLPAEGAAAEVPANLSVHEACEHEIEALRESVETRFEELQRLTRSHQLLRVKAHDALQKLELSQALLNESKAALANAEAMLLQKDADISIAGQAQVEVTERLDKLTGCFHAAVAASHSKSIEQDKKKSQPKLRNKDMKRSDSWNLLKQSWLFDGEWYLRSYPDVAQAEWEPVEHYLCFGAKENRDPGPLFSTADYLSENADVAEAEINPLVHYIKYGCREMRRAVPRLTK
jgi:hypothetical protein